MSAAIDHLKQFQAIADRITALRLRRDVSEAEMLLGIADIEDNPEEMGVLRLAGCENIERFVRRLEVCDVARYLSFRDGIKRVGRDEALRIGAEATIEAAKLTSGAAATKYLAAVDAWHEERGVSPSRQTAKHIRQQVDPIPEVPRALRQKSAAAESRDEVERLRSEIAKLKAKLARAEKERDEALRRCTQLSKELSAVKKKR